MADNHALWIAVTIILLVVVVFLVGGAGLLRRAGWLKAKAQPAGDPMEEAVRLGYEPEDARALDIARVLLIVAGTAGAAIGIVFLLVGMFTTNDRDAQAPLTPQQRAQVQPPAPNLQADPLGDIARMRDRQQAALDGYGWADAAHDHARIPIRRAMALTVGHSLDAVP
jgi:hypothetical protein